MNWGEICLPELLNCNSKGCHVDRWLMHFLAALKQWSRWRTSTVSMRATLMTQSLRYRKYALATAVFQQHMSAKLCQCVRRCSYWWRSISLLRDDVKQAVREAATICPLQVDLLTLKVVSKSHVTWPTSMPILVFVGLSILDLDPIYVRDRRQTRIIHRLMSPTLGAGA